MFSKTKSSEPLTCLNQRTAGIWIAFISALLTLFGGGAQMSNAQVVETPEFVLDSGSVTAGGFEDRDGILWFATANGALRYDYRKAKYFHTDGSAFLSRVGTIAEDTEGRLWFGRSAGGVVVYDKTANSFTSYTHDPDDPRSLSSDTMNWVPRLIATRSDGSVWIGTKNGLNLLDEKAGGFRHYFHDPEDPDTLAGNDIWGLHVDTQDRLWVATSSGLSRLDPGTDRFVNYLHDPAAAQGLPSDQVYSVGEGHQGEIWIGTENGLSQLDVASATFKTYQNDPDDPTSLSHNHVLSITVDRLGRLWLGRLFSIAAGVEMFDPASETFHVILRNTGATEPDSTETILSVFESKDGTIWLPYNIGPVYRIFPDRSVWTARFEDKGLFENHLEPVLVVNEDNSGGLWVGGVGGLKQYSRTTKSYSRWSPVADLSDSADPTVKLDEVNTILAAGDDKIWVGEVDSDFLLIDVKTKSILRRLKADQPAFGTWGGVYDPANPNVIWFGSQTSGLGRVDTTDGSYQFFNSTSNIEAGINAAFVSRVTAAQEGTFWLSTWGQGLLKFDGEKVVATYLHDPSDPTSIGSSNVSEVEVGPNGQLWIATIEGGLNILDEEAGTFARIGREAGLTTNTIFAIETGDDGFLWLATNDGVFKFDPTRRKAVARYGQKDALPSDVFLSWPGGAFMTSDQDLMLGTLSGLGVISTPLLTDEGGQPRVIFTSLTQSGATLPLQTAVEGAQEIDLYWPNRDFEFEASVVGQAGHAHRDIRYKLENFTTDWFVADSASLGRYSRLPGGQYTLLVQGRVGDGSWSDSTRLVVTVHPPFWQKLWFRTLVVLLFLGALLGFVVWRLRIVARLVVAAEAVRDSEERLRLLTDSLPVLIGYIDTERRYQFNNKVYETWFGMPQNDFKGLHVKDVLGGGYDVIREKLDLAMTGQTVIYETMIPFSESDVRFIHSTYVPEFGKDGSVLGLFVLVEDITETRSVQERLRQAQKMEAVGQMTGGIAHDFNNLLSVILAAGEELQTQEKPDQDLIADVVHTAERGAELIRRLLAFSRQQTLKAHPVNLAKLVDGMKDHLARALGEEVRIETKAATGLWLASVDSHRVEDAILNLAINAKHAMPQGGKLTIECDNKSLDEEYVSKHPETSVGDYVVVSVSDTGTGMSKEVQQQAFEPFFTTKEVGLGSGLGLSMIYGFAKQSGGHVSIYSEMGQGTTIKLYLPRDYSSATEVDIAPRQTDTPHGSGQKILLIEDNDLVRKLAGKTLETLGYSVTSVHGLSAARKALEEDQAFDLLLSDVMLENEQSGPQFAKQVLETMPDLKVIFMSGYSQEAAKNAGLVGPNDILLTKPIPKHELAKAIHSVFDD